MKMVQAFAAQLEKNPNSYSSTHKTKHKKKKEKKEMWDSEKQIYRKCRLATRGGYYKCQRIKCCEKKKKGWGSLKVVKSGSLSRTNTYILHYNSQNKDEIIHEHGMWNTVAFRQAAACQNLKHGDCRNEQLTCWGEVWGLKLRPEAHNKERPF